MLSLDPVTSAEHNALYAAGDRAQAVLDALADPVTVRVYDGTGQLMGQGAMQTPWATRAAGTLTAGELSSFVVLVSGTPNAATWQLRFESGTRWLAGTFGPGGDFTWSLASWSAGQSGAIGTVTATATDLPIVFGWTIPADVYRVGEQLTAGQESYSLAQHVAAPPGVEPRYAKISGDPGIAVDELTGLVTTDASIASGTYLLEVELSQAPNLAAPANLRVTATGTTSVTLAWDATANAAGYKVERLVGATWTQFALTTALYATASSLTPDTAYSFRVRAYDSLGQDGAYSATVSGTTNAVPSVGAYEPAITGEPQPEQYFTYDGDGGPTYLWFNAHLNLPWKAWADANLENVGDYIGLDPTTDQEVVRSGNPFHSIAITGTTNVDYPFSVPVTRLVTDFVTSGHNRGFYLVANAGGMTIQGRLSATPPYLVVTNTLGQEFTCPVQFTARWVNKGESMTSKDGRYTVLVSTSRRGLFRFDLSGVTGTVQSATMHFTARRTTTTASTLRIFKADPPTFTLGIGNATPQPGLAAQLALANPGKQEREYLMADPQGRVLYGGDFTGCVYNPSDGRVSGVPHLFMGGDVKTVPQYAVNMDPNNEGPACYIIPDPDAPGTTMFRGQIPRIFAEWAGSDGGPWRSNFDALYSWTGRTTDEWGDLPTGGYEEMYCRAYFYLEPEWLEMNEEAKFGLGFDTRFGYWTGTYWEPEGGNGGTFSDGRRRPKHWTWADTTGWRWRADRQVITGQDLRSNFSTKFTDDPAYPYRNFKKMRTYFYNIDNPDQPPGWRSDYWYPATWPGDNSPTGLFPLTTGSQPGYPLPTAYGIGKYPQYTALASNVRHLHAWQTGRWYCLEQRVKLNTVVAPFDQFGNGVGLADGECDTWVNGVLVDEARGWFWRRHPAITIRKAAPLIYMGGATAPVTQVQWYRVNHCVAATAYIGPRVKP